MKKLITTAMMALALAGCSHSLTTPDHTYKPYGLINDTKKSDKVCYDTNVADVILGVIFMETIVAPIYIFGFNVEEPTSLKDPKTGECN